MKAEDIANLDPDELLKKLDLSSSEQKLFAAGARRIFGDGSAPEPVAEEPLRARPSRDSASVDLRPRR